MKPVKGIGTHVQITKPSGWDWVVYYLNEDDPEILAMSVLAR
jgi:hypothetical protein